jgi:hypothetical protein
MDVNSTQMPPGFGGVVRLGGVREDRLTGWEEGRDELIPWQARRHHPTRACPTHFPSHT